MSYIQDIEFDFHVGDSFDLSPSQGSYVISKLLALGAEFYIDGNTIIVTNLPNAPAPAPVEAPEIPAAVEEAPAPQPAPAPKPVAVVEVAAPVAEEKALSEVEAVPIRRAEPVAPKPPVTRSRTKTTVDPVGQTK